MKKVTHSATTDNGADELWSALSVLPADNYGQWVEVGMALHHWSGGSDAGLELFDRWSQTASNYDEQAVRTKWGGFGHGANSLTVATVFKRAGERGWKGCPAKTTRTKTKPSRRVAKSPEDVLRGFRDALPGSNVERDLKERRGLTDEVIEQFELGNYRGRPAILFRDAGVKILGYKVHKGPHLKADGTKAGKGEGIKAQLYPRFHLEADPVWIVAGEPDVWRLVVEGVQAITGTAGEGTWKPEWTAHFKGRDVVVVYDNDSPGRQGQEKLVKELKGLARRLRVVQWPEGLPEGYDVTDWLQAGKPLADLPLVEVHVERKTLQEAKQVIARWLQLSPGEDLVIDVVLGAVVANRFSGDPVWILFVGPPGIIKTEILRTLAEWREIYMLSTLTPSTLISGFVQRDGEDPSLLPKLNGLVMIIKDFTAILDMHREARQQILGDLRDAFDGQMSKAFGSEAGTRSYKSKFGILAAVTPAIDKYSSVGQQLGERFLKLRIKSSDTRSRIRRAMQNSGQEEQMRAELAAAVEGVLLSCEVDDEKAVSIEDQVIEKLVDLADCLAVLRSAVARDGSSKAIEYIPEPEVGTRLVKQFAKLARGMAAIRGKPAVDEDEYRLIRRIARNTLPSKRCELVRTIYNLFADGFLSTQEIADPMNMPTDTAKLALEDLWLLQVVERRGTGKFAWRMSAEFKGRLNDLGFFEEPAPVSGDEVSEGIGFENTEQSQETQKAFCTPPDFSSPQIEEEGRISRDEVSEGRQSAQVQEREEWTL